MWLYSLIFVVVGRAKNVHWLNPCIGCTGTVAHLPCVDRQPKLKLVVPPVVV